MDCGDISLQQSSFLSKKISPTRRSGLIPSYSFILVVWFSGRERERLPMVKALWKSAGIVSSIFLPPLNRPTNLFTSSYNFIDSFCINMLHLCIRLAFKEENIFWGENISLRGENREVIWVLQNPSPPFWRHFLTSWPAQTHKFLGTQL